MHEYGHALQDAQVRDFGGSPQGAAMGEGFGDYLMAALDAQRAPNAKFNPCFAEWDVLGEDEPKESLTRTDRNLTVAQVGPETECDEHDEEDPHPEIHCAGLAWSGALWRIRALIGAAIADRLVVQSHYSLTPSADLTDGSLALVVAERALYGRIDRSGVEES